MTNEEIRNIITDETARLPVNVEFRVTFHRNCAYIYARELEEYERRIERYTNGVYSPYVSSYTSCYPLLAKRVYGIQGEERVRRIVRECVNYAISNVSAPKVHQVPTAEACVPSSEGGIYQNRKVNQK